MLKVLQENSIIAKTVSVGNNYKAGRNSFIKADEVVLGNDVTIGDGVEIVCDKLVLGDGCKIGNNTTIAAPEIILGDSCAIGKGVEVELNEFLRLGNCSVIGNRVTIGGQGVSSGEFLWLKNDVIIGGGGCAGPRSYLRAGNHVAVFDKCYINLSEEVTIGDGTALSYNVVLLTHGAWQPALMGYPTKFGPVHVGAQCVVYLNSVVLPGVSIGDYATIGASSLVNKDVPAYSLASGNPAKVIKGGGAYPRGLGAAEIDALLHDILSDYGTTLPPKKIEVVQSQQEGSNYSLTVVADHKNIGITYYGSENKGVTTAADISLSYGPLPEGAGSAAHFDLRAMTVAGEPGAIGEDLRDYLRRRAIKIFTGKPFRSIPLANLKRMRDKRKNLPNG